uniref:hypothetical protein n=1 Tax=Pseudocalidococcus azoricus TaxID=3110322 RepID=UPI002AF6C67E|nr:hypothetical protein [Pseudocalidococcus azoricus]
MHMDVILAHHSLQDFDILRITNLEDQLPTSFLYLSFDSVTDLELDKNNAGNALQSVFSRFLLSQKSLRNTIKPDSDTS